MRHFPPNSTPAAGVDGLVELRVLSAQARLLRLVMRYGFKTRIHASPDIARIRQSVDRLTRIAPDQPFGVSRRPVEIAGVPAESHALNRFRPDGRILYLHGGAFVCGSPRTHRGIAGRVARGTGAEVIVLDYRLAPEHPFPAALEDATAAYLALLDETGDPSRLAVVGDSAGGNLLFALGLRLKQLGAPMPAAAVALSPFTDFTASGESFRLNAALDPLLHTRGLPSVVEAYAPGLDARDPFLSPIFGDLSGLPPTLIQCGSDEILLDDARRMHAGLTEAGVACDLEIWPRMPHVWQAFAVFLPEGREAIRRINTFLRRRLTGGQGNAVRGGEARASAA